MKISKYLRKNVKKILDIFLRYECRKRYCRKLFKKKLKNLKIIGVNFNKNL